MSTKLSFRARALDPSKAMPIYFAEELPDLQEYSAINRAVPQMPSGMEKEEESVSPHTNAKPYLKNVLNLTFMLMADSGDFSKF
jgi:enhancer of polycomb-like protein